MKLFPIFSASALVIAAHASGTICAVIGETLGNFRVLRLIGAGGMGMVFYAQHVLIGRQAAIKVLKPEFSADPEFVKRFLTETEPLVSRDIRQMVDWTAQGKVAIAALQNADRLDIWEAKRQGLPVESFATGGFKEGGLVGSGGGNVMLVNRAPHPSAARVFVERTTVASSRPIRNRLPLGEYARQDTRKVSWVAVSLSKPVATFQNLTASRSAEATVVPSGEKRGSS